MKHNDDDLRLIYVNKIGRNSKRERLYEFIFSTNPSHIDNELWCWDLIPACDNATPPTEEYIDLLINLKTNKFDLYCLHEAVDRPYMHGYHTIHALAYETYDGDNNYGTYETMFEQNNDDLPILVFHYDMSLTKIKELLDLRGFVLKDNEFIDASSIKF